ncbi:MAG: trigger factor [Oscillospiraceae bacterium]
MSLVSSKQVETNRTELIVKVEGEQFSKAVDAAFRKNAKKIALPGFRRGKAPRAMIEHAYGKGVFYEDAMNDLYPAAYSEAVKEAGIEPVDTADVEVMEVGDEGFTLKATVTTKPVAELGQYKELEAVKNVKEVTDEEIERNLSELREKYARVVTVEDRPAKDGDVTDINFEGFVDGVAFEGGKGENYPLTLGSNTFIPGFEGQVAGHAIGEEFDVNVTFPEEYGEAALAGKAATFKVRLNELKEKQLPELDDEFAKDISEFDTLDAYKTDLREKLAKQYAEQADAEFENQLMDAVVNGMKVEVPACMINARIEELVQDFSARMEQQGLKLDDFIRYSGESPEKFHESFRPQAERQVKARLAMEAIAKAEQLGTTDEEIDAEYKKLAEAYKADADKLRLYFPRIELEADVACRKALDLIVSSGKVVSKKTEEPQEAASENAAQ